MGRQRNGSVFDGNIIGIRAVEDTIRATRNYTEGVLSEFRHHPVQGMEFPSRVLCKHYEVYPDTELSWHMPWGTMLDWLWGDVPMITVIFRYDYRANRASIMVRAGAEAVAKLAKAIPGFSDALSRALANRSSHGSIEVNQKLHQTDTSDKRGAT